MDAGEVKTSSFELAGRGVSLAVRDWGGDGPLAVISHANGFCSALYAPIAEQLRGSHRVIAFDSRGHGDSTTPDSSNPYEWREFALDWLAIARALCESLGASEVGFAIGHSFGGSALLDAAAREPGRFRRLALLDPVLTSPADELPGRGPDTMAAVASRRNPVFPSRAAIRKSWSRRGIFADWDSRVLDLYLEEGFRDLPDGRVAIKCAPEVEAAIYEAGPRHDLFAALAELRTPTLWLHAGAGTFPLSLVERAAASSHYVELESLPAGHLMPMIDPHGIARRLLAWSHSGNQH